MKRRKGLWFIGGLLVLAVFLVGACTAVVYGLRATLWEEVEPDLVLDVEPDQVERVYEHSLYMGSTDDSSGERITVFYATSLDYATVRQHYIEALTTRGLGWREHMRPVGTRAGSFTKPGEEFPCLTLHPYPDDTVEIPSRAEAGEVRLLRPTYSVQYYIHHGWFHDTTPYC